MLDLDALSARHRRGRLPYAAAETYHCAACRQVWPCEARLLARELTAARVVIAAAPEWSWDLILEEHFCPECGNTQDDGHQDCCGFGAALATYRAVVGEAAP